MRAAFGDRIASTRFGRRVTALADTMLNGVDLTLAEVDAGRICRLPAKGYRAAEFDMSRARAEALTDAAQRAMAAFLDELEPRTPSGGQDPRRR